jgi:hypothetical protein
MSSASADSVIRASTSTLGYNFVDSFQILQKYYNCFLNAALDPFLQSGDSSSQTALHLAVRYGVLPAVAILASYGADVNAEDSSGMTPLHLASGTLQKDIVSSLIKLGADINAVCFRSFKSHFAGLVTEK